jgi:hypothetical protein
MGTTYTLTLNGIAVYDLPTPSKTRLSAAKRDEILQKAVDWKVTHQNLREEQRGEHQVILVRERRIRRNQHETISIDDYGLVTATRPGPPKWEYLGG